ncbi:MAG: hypothetical protein HYY02_00175 [Chloroflexi bacterium]|nr:hypothetical protein [Chloroflexota bacterium]
MVRLKEHQSIDLCPKLSGSEFDDTLGLIYLRARYYDPATGRFLSKDPAGGKLALPGHAAGCLFGAHRGLAR